MRSLLWGTCRNLTVTTACGTAMHCKFKDVPQWIQLRTYSEQRVGVFQFMELTGWTELTEVDFTTGRESSGPCQSVTAWNGYNVTPTICSPKSNRQHCSILIFKTWLKHQDMFCTHVHCLHHHIYDTIFILHHRIDQLKCFLSWQGYYRHGLFHFSYCRNCYRRLLVFEFFEVAPC